MLPGFKPYYKAIVIKTVQYDPKTESPEINPHTYGQSICDKSSNLWPKCGRNSLCNKWCWEHCFSAVLVPHRTLEGWVDLSWLNAALRDSGIFSHPCTVAELWDALWGCPRLHAETSYVSISALWPSMNCTVALYELCVLPRKGRMTSLYTWAFSLQTYLTKFILSLLPQMAMSLVAWNNWRVLFPYSSGGQSMESKIKVLLGSLEGVGGTPASLTFSWLSVFFGLWSHHSNLCFWGHIAFFLCV